MTDQTNSPVLPVVAHLHASAFDYFANSDDNYIVEQFGQHELCLRASAMTIMAELVAKLADAIASTEALLAENARMQNQLASIFDILCDAKAIDFNHEPPQTHSDMVKSLVAERDQLKEGNYIHDSRNTVFHIKHYIDI